MRNNAADANIRKDCCWELDKIDERHQGRDPGSLCIPEKKWFAIYNVSIDLIFNLADPGLPKNLTLVCLLIALFYGNKLSLDKYVLGASYLKFTMKFHVWYFIWNERTVS